MLGQAREKKARALLPLATTPFISDAVHDGALALVKRRSDVPSLGVQRGGRRAGVYLLDDSVLLVDREEERAEADIFLRSSGYEPRPGLDAPSDGEAIPRIQLEAVGSWGRVLLASADFTWGRPGINLAIYFLNSGILLTTASSFGEAVTKSLSYSGLAVSAVTMQTVPEGERAKLLENLEWDPSRWNHDDHLDGPSFETPQHRVGRRVTRTLTAAAAGKLPDSVAAAVNAVLSVPVYNRWVRAKGPRYLGRFSLNAGAIEREALDKLTAAAPNIELPEGWQASWSRAWDVSPTHAPTLAALYLRQHALEWWDDIAPTEGVREAQHAMWLVGYSSDKPAFIRASHTLDEEVRLATVVGLLGRAMPDMEDLVELSTVTQACAICGRSYEPGMLMAGAVYRLKIASACPMCSTGGMVRPNFDASELLEAGAVGAIQELTRRHGGIVASSMIDELALTTQIPPTVLLTLRHVLPLGTERSWTTWLSKAGVLGDGWRSSRGHITTAADGHVCRSLFERYVDDYLYARGVWHEIEPPYPYDPDLNPTGLRADWKLADGRFVEAAGLMSNAEYACKMARKAELAVKHGIELVVLTDSDLPRLAERLALA